MRKGTICDFLFVVYSMLYVYDVMYYNVIHSMFVAIH